MAGLAMVLGFTGNSPWEIFTWSALLLFLLPFLYVHVRAIEQSCMIKQVSPSKLAEGDWLLRDVKVAKGKTIKKTVHGLSLNDIKLLQRAKKKVWIKEGIPFTPAFLISILTMIIVLKYFV